MPELRPDHHVQWSICPHCGALQDGAANMTGEKAPEEGDISMCFECGGWSEFGEDGVTRHELTDKSKLDDPYIQLAIATYWHIRGEHPERWSRG